MSLSYRHSGWNDRSSQSTHHQPTKITDTLDLGRNPTNHVQPSVTDTLDSAQIQTNHTQPSVTDTMAPMANQYDQTTPTANSTADDIAVVGFSFKLPQDVDDVSSFWDVLQNRKNLMTRWPESRMNAESFLSGNKSKVRRIYTAARGRWRQNPQTQAFLSSSSSDNYGAQCSSIAMAATSSTTTRPPSMLPFSLFRQKKPQVCARSGPT